MHILVITGSPKGENSITYQTVRYLQVVYPQHTYDVLHVGARIKSLEKDMTGALDMLRAADLLLFCYPVYTFIAPSQLHRFITLVKQSGVDLTGKWATQITTSKHFYDVTAHRYVQDNCMDMGLRVVKGLSADMDDLLSEQGRKDARAFFEYVMYCVENGIALPPAAPLPAPAHKPVTPLAAADENKPGDVVIVADLAPDDAQLAAMIGRFRTALPLATRVVNIREFPFKGGCLGCFHCAVTGKCVYTDGFDDFLRGTIQKAQAIVFAFSIEDHSMGANFKRYNDREFCNGHRTVTMGMPMGYLVSGDYSREENLRMILESRAQVGGNFLCGVATDEFDPDGEIDALAKTLSYALEHSYNPPKDFYGVGGMKVFRDLIWLMQGMMRADHKFYKAHGQYDFPQKKWPTMLKMYAVGMLLTSPNVQKKMGSAMTRGMLAPYEKVLAKAKENNA